MANTLTSGRWSLLQLLETNGGSVSAEKLSGPIRSLATRMQREGLVKWEAPWGSHRWTCNGQILHITDAGRAAAKLSNKMIRALDFLENGLNPEDTSICGITATTYTALVLCGLIESREWGSHGIKRYRLLKAGKQALKEYDKQQAAKAAPRKPE